MTIEQLLHDALDQYNLRDAATTLLGALWNTTYCVTAADGQQYSLRICGETFLDRKCLEDELTFTEFIARQGKVDVPEPVRNRRGELVTLLATPPGSRQCCLFKWLPGTEAHRRLSIPLLHQMGQATAYLHLAAQAFAFPSAGDGFRNGYYFDDVLVASHRGWIDEHRLAIGEERVALLKRTIDGVLHELARIGKTRATYGFIHADLHPGNFLVHQNQVAVIDFDQLGRGHFAFDLAVMMVELLRENAKNFEEYWASFKRGYENVAPLPVADDGALTPFVMAVHLGFLDWFYNSMNPQVREGYRVRATQTYELVQEWVDRYHV